MSLRIELTSENVERVLAECGCAENQPVDTGAILIECGCAKMSHSTARRLLEDMCDAHPECIRVGGCVEAVAGSGVYTISIRVYDEFDGWYDERVYSRKDAQGWGFNIIG